MTTSNWYSDAQLQSPDAVVHVLGDNGKFTNNQKLPLVLYQNAVKLPERAPAAIFEAIFHANQWGSSGEMAFTPTTRANASKYSVQIR